jgi:hypothetical protein
VVYHVWANWGLVTIHAKGTDLGKVIASMERQGHAKIVTDMASSTTVDMDVNKVPLAFALEKLSVITNSRWRLLYFAAPDKGTVMTGEDGWASGKQPTDWTMISIPFGNQAIQLDDTDPPVIDPRDDTYSPKAAAPAPLQTFFKEAAQLTNAGFAFPTAWNPSVNSTPPSGTITKVVPKLVGKAGGHVEMVFFLSQNNQGPGPGGFAQGDFDPELLAQRVQAEINRLPPEEKTEAQNNFDTEKAFRASLATMSDTDRMAAMMAHYTDPNLIGSRLNRMDAQENMMNHDQKMQRFQNYVNRKMAATGKMQQQ